MYIIKNTKGNLVFYQSRNLKNCWGFIDDNGDYITERSVKKSQIFHFFKNAIAIQEELLALLEKEFKNNHIKVWIPDYEREEFWAIVKVKDFRKMAIEEFGINKAIFNYDKKDFSRYGVQVRLPLHCFVREYKHQRKLKSEIYGNQVLLV